MASGGGAYWRDYYFVRWVSEWLTDWLALNGVEGSTFSPNSKNSLRLWFHSAPMMRQGRWILCSYNNSKLFTLCTCWHVLRYNDIRSNRQVFIVHSMPRLHSRVEPSQVLIYLTISFSFIPLLLLWFDYYLCNWARGDGCWELADWLAGTGR